MSTGDSPKKTVVRKSTNSKKYWMADREYTGIVIGREATNDEYVICDGIIEPGGFIPNHFHKWEDQTFHVTVGNLRVKIGDEFYDLGPGDTVHCPRGISHYMKNVGTETASLISYIFPGTWAEGYMEESTRQNRLGAHDPQLIEEQFGIVYIENPQEE